MNIWPHKNGPYDPLTYDVRRTMSVRVMIHGPWVELKFPKRNLPLRRMHNDVEPSSVTFIGHKEVIDLTNCQIDLFPENLPNKRCDFMFCMSMRQSFYPLLSWIPQHGKPFFASGLGVRSTPYAYAPT